MPTLTETPDDIYYRQILHDLIDRGADLARRLHESATAAAPTPENHPDADPTIAFDRIARAIRRTIALARHIAQPPAAAKKPGPSRETARAQLIRGVEDAIHRKSHETDAEALYTEFAERLDRPELEFELDNRPIDEIIQEICRDLGVAQQARSYIWKRRTPEDVAALQAKANAPPLHLIQGGRQDPKRE